jgi:SAM-dependent methyltransferase
MNYDQYSASWISKKKSKTHWAHDYLEKPAMFDNLPDLKDKTVLCLGCGSGEECEYLLGLGAAKIIGVDSSSELIDWAKIQFELEIKQNKLEFVCATIEAFQVEKESVDFVFSSLTMHYVDDWTKTLQCIKSWIKPNATFDFQIIFSCHHPIKWGSETFRSRDYNEFKLGYYKSKKLDSHYKIYGDYLTSRPITDKLFGHLEIIHYHKSISTMFLQISKSGLIVNAIIEPLPLDLTKTIKQDFFETYSKIPLFVIWKLTVC